MCEAQKLPSFLEFANSTLHSESISTTCENALSLTCDLFDLSASHTNKEYDEKLIEMCANYSNLIF